MFQKRKVNICKEKQNQFDEKISNAMGMLSSLINELSCTQKDVIDDKLSVIKKATSDEEKEVWKDTVMHVGVLSNEQCK